MTMPPEPTTILVADDYHDTRLIVAEILEDAGYKVEQAATGLEALEKVTRLLPQVVLMDLSLPGMDGWEVIRRLRLGESTKNLAIIALTAHALENHIERAMRAGADKVVTKPCDPAFLLEQIDSVIHERATAAS
jgi:CheY-like chemotaxis protein